MVALSANGLYGVDVAEFWEKMRIIDSAVVTPKDLTLTLISHRSLSGWGVRIPAEQRRLDVVPGGKIVLVPDQAMVFQGRHVRITFTPVSFKSKHKGFRMERVSFGFGSTVGKPADIAYMAFSDTPLTVGEDDVVMVMDDGKWVKAEDSRSLEIAKLGVEAEYLIEYANQVMQNPETMAMMLNHLKSAQLWNTLIERGLIKTNAEDRAQAPTPSHEDKENSANVTEDEPSEEKSKASHFWLYVILFHLILFPTLYFMRRKKT